VLKKGDLVKIELGAHIDGYIAVGAETCFIEKHDGKDHEDKSQLLAALRSVEEALDKLMVPGETNLSIANAVNEIAAKYNCSPIKGANIDLVERMSLRGEKSIIITPDDDQKIEEFTLQENEVYSINILLSTGDGKPKPGETRTTIFQKSKDISYNLKLKSSRSAFNEINHKFQYFPFTLRSFEDVNKARMGITELVNHLVVDPFPVLFEKPGKLVAQKRYLVFVLPGKKVKLALKSVSEEVESKKSNDKDVVMEENSLTSSTPPPSRKRSIESSEMEDVTSSSQAKKRLQKKKKK
jgi:curved DNA binding protein